MKIKEKTYVIFRIPIEGSGVHEAKVYTEELRKVLKNAGKEEKDVEVEIETESIKTKLVMKLSELKSLIKSAELGINIVPKFMAKYLVDLTRVFATSNKTRKPIVGRDNEIEQVWFYLSQKTRNNVFLVGEADVGKTTIAREIVRQISTNECPKEFYETRVLMLKPEHLLSISNGRIYERFVNAILNFIVKHKENIILYIDQGIYMKTDEALIMMLQTLIAKYNVPIISTMDVENFEKYFLQDGSISKHLNYIYVEEPELEEIEPMIENHIKKLEKRYKIKISKEMIKFGIFTSVLSKSLSCEPGNVINVFERAFIEAKRNDKEEVDKQSILSCYDSYLKLYNKITAEEKKSTAYHEAGHYVVSALCEHIKDRKIAFVSILPMMDFLGVNWSYIIPGRTLSYNKDYFLDAIAISMGGRIAEKLVTHENSTGASSDLEHANAIAESMITVYGMSSNSDSLNRSYVTGEYGLKTYLMHEEKKKAIDKEVQELINIGTEIAENIISQNTKLVEMVANALLKEEILTGEELLKIVEEYKNNK